MSIYETKICLHMVNCAGFITFYFFVATHVTACDVHVSEKAEMYNNAAFIVQIYISCKEKCSYSQRDIGMWHEGGFAVISRALFVHNNL